MATESAQPTEDLQPNEPAAVADAAVADAAVADAAVADAAVADAAVADAAVADAVTRDAAADRGAAIVADAAARRRLDEVFGDVLATVSSDELGIDEPVRNIRPGGLDLADEELLANRPPHHDRD